MQPLSTYFNVAANSNPITDPYTVGGGLDELLESMTVFHDTANGNVTISMRSTTLENTTIYALALGNFPPMNNIPLEVFVFPRSTTVPVNGGNCQFHTVVTSSNQSVTWSVQEPGGGTVIN